MTYLAIAFHNGTIDTLFIILNIEYLAGYFYFPSIFVRCKVKVIYILRRLIISVFFYQRADSCLNTNDINIPMHASTKVIRNRRINYHVKTSEYENKLVT
jgi:hypothetical protein